MLQRRYSMLDKIITQVDHAVNTIVGSQQSQRPDPASHVEDQSMSDADKKHSAALMRVNHTGEVCAQALYRGQLVFVKTKKTQDMLEEACSEETDHLNWTDKRISALDGHRSYLNSFWYFNSFLMGMLASAFGDKWSLGFIEETENQVAKHLDSHLGKLPRQDLKSRAVIRQMREDELHHGQAASEAGGVGLPAPVKLLMGFHSKVMTTLAYYL